MNEFERAFRKAAGSDLSPRLDQEHILRACGLAIGEVEKEFDAKIDALRADIARLEAVLERLGRAK
ncbi:hypothetical protein [Sinorhizobium meliloti]|uniref:hypothetical protein n=1 Tax=Rhizobium meliloti TaxID=382 RepID=UPI000FD7FDCC|nr:hypothetical protein [Sinorhizobium meliloti]RVI43665.1 hypothetical protein CN195_28215 [Sinorhizobium meliloti]